MLPTVTKLHTLNMSSYHWFEQVTGVPVDTEKCFR